MTIRRCRRWYRAGVVAAAAVAGPAISAALDVQLDRPAMMRALQLARWPATDADRASFHSRYVFDVPDESAAPIRIDRIEVITEFRRLELLAEQHARLNDLWGRPGTRDAEEALQRWRGSVWLSIHGLYRSLAHPEPGPADIAIRLDEPATAARSVNRALEYGGGCGSDLWPCAIAGVRIEAQFDAARLARAVRPVVVDWNGVTLARVTVDFRSLE